MEKSDCIFNINGGNVQVLPNATTAIQYNFGCGEHGNDSPTPLDPYIHDHAERRNFIQRISLCPDVTTLCKTVLSDLYNDVIADYANPQEIIKGKEFISAIIPLLTFDSGKTVENIRAGIRKYVLAETT